jgi:colicin import membrane protein
MSTELITIEPANAITFFTKENGLSEIVKQVEMEIATFEHDLTTGVGRKRTASLAAKVSKTKVYLDDLGKDLVADWKAKAKVVDSNRKDMRDALDSLRDLARKPLTEWEEEQKRIEAEANAAKEAEELRLKIESDFEIAILMNEKFDRDAEDARKQREEAERIAAELAEKARIEREEQIKREAVEAERLAARKEKEAAEIARLSAIKAKEDAEKARAAAEERAIEQAKQAEAARIAAEEKAKRDAELAAEAAKRAEIARQQAVKEAEDKAIAEREANKAHVAKIRKAAKEALMALCGLSEDDAKAVVMAINNRTIPSVEIRY